MYEMLLMVPSLLFLNMFSSLFQMFAEEMWSLGKCGTQVCKVFSVFQICHSFSLAKFLGCCGRSSDQVILHSIGIRTNPHIQHIYRWNINKMIYISLWPTGHPLPSQCLQVSAYIFVLTFHWNG